jgi:hypothetical protein
MLSNLDNIGSAKSGFTQGGDADLKSALTSWLQSKVELIRANIFARAKASGRLAQEINIIPPYYEGTTLKTGITMGQADYWVYIDKGVKGKESTYSQSKNSPFKYKLKKPPLAAMQSFIATKGIKSFKLKKKTLSASNPKENKQMGFILQNSIFKKGIKGTKFYSDVINKKSVKELSTFIKPYLGKYIQIQIKQAWQSQ